MFLIVRRALLMRDIMLTLIRLFRDVTPLLTLFVTICDADEERRASLHAAVAIAARYAAAAHDYLRRPPRHTCCTRR
jgi:hypothetical protein